jgi:uncharacterized membrane protein
MTRKIIMGKGRLEAFSDGVLAIIITIMVLELKTPQSGEWEALRPLVHIFLSYLLSFVFIGIYWNNHHHLFQAVSHVTGPVLWANLHLLFWLSIIPFATAWMGENHFPPLAVAFYGVILLLSGVAYFILVRALLAHHGEDSKLARAIGKDTKGKISVAIYACAIPFAFLNEWIAYAGYIAVALLWLYPDRRIEKVLK